MNKAANRRNPSPEPAIPGPQFIVTGEESAEKDGGKDLSPVSEMIHEVADFHNGAKEAELAVRADLAVAAAPTPVTISLSLGDVPPDVYLTDHVEVRLNHDQAYGLRRLWYGIEASDARLASGKRPESNADVVRWLLEQIGGAAN